jgi:hypothetical protein
VNACVLFGALLLVGCARKAPGPDECQAFAARALGLTDARQLANPGIKNAYDELLVRCLTTPYDRALLRCIEARSSSGLMLHGRQLTLTPGAETCLREFAARRIAERGEPEPRRLERRPEPRPGE